MVEELNGSELGTKQYWDVNYHHEITNYNHYGDVGEIWFDESSQQRIINWILRSSKFPHDIKIIDLGCGNGMMLVDLARSDFTNLHGIDYSANAIVLASSIAKDKNVNITYKVVDLMNLEQCKELGVFGIVHDKGTYDAISLCPEDSKLKRSLYMEAVYNFMDENALFIITSCNWTDKELEMSFNEKFVKQYTIPTPYFKFGNKIGSVVTTLVFKKK